MTTWKEYFASQRDQPYMLTLQRLLREERAKYKVYPPNCDVFNAYKLAPFNKVRVVFMGQDPYYWEGQAHGMAYSVRPGITVPPSLVNIYQEMHNDIGFTIPNHGDLTKWAQQGVLLTNSMLTVREGESSTHAGIGWERFTDGAIAALSQYRSGIIFALWGNFARSKARLIDRTKHHILECAHPSPRSADRGFFGCGHFGQINSLLAARGESIDWSL